MCNWFSFPPLLKKGKITLPCRFINRTIIWTWDVRFIMQKAIVNFRHLSTLLGKKSSFITSLQWWYRNVTLYMQITNSQEDYSLNPETKVQIVTIIPKKDIMFVILFLSYWWWKCKEPEVNSFPFENQCNFFIYIIAFAFTPTTISNIP